MLRPSAQLVSALCAAVVFAVATPVFAQSKAPPLIGITRDQIVARLGDPRSDLKAGTREILFYAHVKLTLRNGIVVETEDIADELPRRAPELAPGTTVNGAAPAAAAAQAAAPGATTSAPAPANSESGNSSTASPTADGAVTPVKPPPPPEPVLEIKFIRSRGSSAKSAARPLPSPEPVAVEKLPTKAVASAAPNFPLPPPNADKASAPTPAPASVKSPSPATTNSEVAAGATGAEAKVAFEPPAATDVAGTVEEVPEKPAVDPKKKAAVRQRWRLRRDAETGDEPVQLFSTQTYVIALITMIGGVGYLWWRRTQRNLALAASAVSHTPFEAAAAMDATGQFTADQIGKLGAKRFERLVASYYAKTGVVAERTNAAPDSPVQIKIFWKGEPKPFAGVQCHANPPSLIGAKPLQDLFAALTVAEIRRGYVVTTGKFNVEARDYAEEKHFTLLSGDLFLEKLNALPPPARAELLKETSTEEPEAPAAGPHAPT